MTICGWFTSIPDVVWSGLIASFLTLSGVFLSNASNTKRLRMQLDHEASEKVKQRKAELRKEVYLKAAEEFVKANAHLGSLPQLDPAQVNIGQGMLGFFAASMKLQMVSEVHTSVLASQLSEKYAELLFKLSARAFPIQQLNTDIVIATDHYENMQSEIQRILAAMAQQNESGKPDPAVFNALSQSFEHYREQSENISSDRNRLWQEKNAKHLEYARALVPEMKSINRQGVLLMVEIRRELNVGGDIDVFLENMEAQADRIAGYLDELLEQIART